MLLILWMQCGLVKEIVKISNLIQAMLPVASCKKSLNFLLIKILLWILGMKLFDYSIMKTQAAAKSVLLAEFKRGAICARRNQQSGVIFHLPAHTGARRIKQLGRRVVRNGGADEHRRRHLQIRLACINKTHRLSASINIDFATCVALFQLIITLYLPARTHEE